VPHQESAEAQYIYAGLVPTKAAWLKVIEYRPYDEFFALLAKKELALLYLQDNDLEEATAIFIELADLPAFENELRTFGLAGLCVVDSLEGRHNEAMARAQSLFTLLRFLDPRMREALRQAVALSNPASTGAWEAWLNEAFSSDQGQGADGTDGSKSDRKKTAPPEKGKKT